jgi:hypothetical protein
MDERDRELRNRIYGQLVELGRVPTIEETGADAESLRRLHDEHALVDMVAGRPEPDDLVAHILLPARRWWEDIVFT